MAITEKAVAGLLTEAVGHMTNPHRNDFGPSGLPAEEPGQSLEDWISTWAQENGSAVEIWGNEEIWEGIKAVVDTGCEIKAVALNPEDGPISELEHKVILDNPGFKKLVSEDNIDSAEIIIYKPCGGAQTPPAKPSVATPKVANVEALLNRAVKRIGDSSMDLSRSAGVAVAQLADGIEDMASMVAGLITRTPGYDQTPNGRKLAELLRHADYFLSQAHEIVDDEANAEGEQERRKTRLPSMANTPAAESVELVRKMIGEVAKDVGGPQKVARNSSGMELRHLVQMATSAGLNITDRRHSKDDLGLVVFELTYEPTDQSLQQFKMFSRVAQVNYPGARIQIYPDHNTIGIDLLNFINPSGQPQGR